MKNLYSTPHIPYMREPRVVHNCPHLLFSSGSSPPKDTAAAVVQCSIGRCRSRSASNTASFNDPSLSATWPGDDGNWGPWCHGYAQNPICFGVFMRGNKLQHKSDLWIPRTELPVPRLIHQIAQCSTQAQYPSYWYLTLS